MRIAILSDPRNFHCQKWATALARAGAEVYVISIFSPEKDPQATANLGYQVINLAPETKSPNYGTFVRTAPALRQTLRRIEADIVHPLHLTPYGNWARMAGYGPIVSAAIGADVLSYPPRLPWYSPLLERDWLRGQSHSLSAPTRLWAWARNRFFRHEVARTLAASRLITADNQVLLDSLHQWFRVPVQRMALIRWGIDPDTYAGLDTNAGAMLRTQLGLNPAASLILAPRGLTAFYHADLILDAAARWLPTAPQDWQLVLLGAGYHTEVLLVRKAQELMARFGDRVHYIPQQLEPMEMAALWQNTRVMLNLPLFDGYSSSLAEARYHGALPIVNAIPAHAELLNHGQDSLWLTEMTAPALADALTLATTSDTLRQQAAHRNRDWVLANGLLRPEAEKALSLFRTLY